MILKAMEKAVIKTYDKTRAILWCQDTSQGKGQFLGVAVHPYDPRLVEEVSLDPDCHLYIVGGSGAGKTKAIEGLLQEDIEESQGFGILDFHGDLTRHILQYFAHEAAQEDLHQDLEQGRLALMKPSDPEWAVGFNPLAIGEGTSAYGVALELLAIIHKVWGTGVFGPRSEELMRNLFVALAEAGETLDMAGLFLTHAPFRENVVQKITNPEVRAYWRFRYGQLSKGMQAAFREPVLNKLTAFLADSHLLAMVGQRESPVSFRRVMDEGGWLVVDLSKGQLKANASLLGGFFLAKLKEAAFSRGDLPEEARCPFYLYLDEFQNVAAENFVEVLTEARKYKLFLRLAHQHLDQLDRELRVAIFGNVGAILAFRLSHHDAVVLAPELDPKEARVWERRLTDLKVGEAVFKRKGEKPRMVKIRRVTTPSAKDKEVEAIKHLSDRRYARPKVEVLQEIERRREATWSGVAPAAWREQEAGSDANDDVEGQTDW